MMFKARIVYAMIVLVVASNMAWALEVHINNAIDDVSQPLLVANQDGNDTSSVDLSGQHCSHLQAHLLGVPISNHLTGFSSSNQVLGHSVSFSTHLTTPLLRPPSA